MSDEPYRSRPVISGEQKRQRDEDGWALTDATRADLIASIMDAMSGDEASAREWADRMYERLENVPHYVLAWAFVVELTANGCEQKARERLAWLEDQALALHDNGID